MTLNLFAVSSILVSNNQDFTNPDVIAQYYLSLDVNIDNQEDIHILVNGMLEIQYISINNSFLSGNLVLSINLIVQMIEANISFVKNNSTDFAQITNIDSVEYLKYLTASSYQDSYYYDPFLLNIEKNIQQNKIIWQYPTEFVTIDNINWNSVRLDVFTYFYQHDNNQFNITAKYEKSSGLLAELTIFSNVQEDDTIEISRTSLDLKSTNVKFTYENETSELLLYGIFLLFSSVTIVILFLFKKRI